MIKRIGFTGHRPERVGNIYGYNHPVWCAISQDVAYRITPYIMKGADAFYNGLAIGFDLATAFHISIARLTLYPHIKLVGVVPFPGQEDLWTPRDQTLYMSVLNACDHVIFTSKTKPKRQQDATRLFLERNTQIIDNIDLLICLWDRMEYGGTWDAIQKAQAKGIPIEYMYVGDYLKKG